MIDVSGIKTEITTLRSELAMSEFIAGFVDPERFLSMCAKCKNFGCTWACPPYDFDPMSIWQEYSRILLYAKKVCLPVEETEKTRPADELASVYKALLKPVADSIRKELLELEGAMPGSLALFAGGCDICQACTREKGEPCAHPELMRFSVESLGGDVIKSFGELLHERVLWAENGRLPEHFILMGALLMK